MAANRKPERTASQIAHLRWNAYNVFCRESMRHCKGYEIAVWNVLFCESRLHDERDYSVLTISTYQIAEMTGYSRSQVMRAIDGLIEKCLLRRRSPGDFSRNQATRYAIYSRVKLNETK